MTTADLPTEDPTGGTSVLGEGQPSEGGGGSAPEQRDTPDADTNDRFAGARSGVSSLRDQAIEQARGYAETGKETLSTTIGGYAETVREAAQDIEARTTPEIAKYAHQAADFLEEAAETLRTKDVEELIDEARALVRRSPALAIGAAAAIGFALSRFLKATSEQLEPAFAPPTSRRAEPRYDA